MIWTTIVSATVAGKSKKSIDIEVNTNDETVTFIDYRADGTDHRITVDSDTINAIFRVI